MTIQECFIKLGGNYEEGIGRLMNDRILTKFILKFPGDTSYALLKENLEAGNLEEAFRGAHSLKGVARNLAFTDLGNSASDLTEILRPGHEELRIQKDIDEKFAKVTADYERTIQALEEYKTSNGL